MRRAILLTLLAITPLWGQVQNPSSILIQDEGTLKGATRIVNCIGSSVTCDVVAGVGTVTVTGGGGGGNFLDVTINLDTTIGVASLWQSRQAGTQAGAAFSDMLWSDTCRRFVGVGNGSAIISHTGGEWITTTLAQANLMSGVAYGPSLNRLAAVSSNGTDRVQTSDDCGVTWTVRTASEANTWTAVVWSPDLSLFAAVSIDGTNRVMTSPTGVTWTAQAAAEANIWNDIAWSPELDLYAAVASSGATNRAMTSPNGTAWTARALSSASSWQAVTWSSGLGLFVAVANETGSNARVATSSDGTTWTTQTAPTGLWNEVTWAPELNLLVAVSGTATTTNRVMTSPDAITWTLRDAPVSIQASGSTWAAVAWSPELGMFAAGASAGSNETRIMTSTNRIDPGLVYTVTVTGQSWVSATSQILCSPFGTTADGLTVETVFASGVQAIASNRIVGTGFDLSVFTPNGASGTYRFHCTGS